jgi:hypothetical protein
MSHRFEFLQEIPLSQSEYWDDISVAPEIAALNLRRGFYQCEQCYKEPQWKLPVLAVSAKLRECS